MITIDTARTPCSICAVVRNISPLMPPRPCGVLCASAVKGGKGARDSKDKPPKPGTKKHFLAANKLIVGYDPAKASEGGLAALYNGKLIWCGPVMIWDIDEELDVCSGFENIRDAWLSLPNIDPINTVAKLHYERSGHGAHFARAAISEAGGAAFPFFTAFLAGKQKDVHPHTPNAWRNIVFGDVGKLIEAEWKAKAFAFAHANYGYAGDSHNVAEAICIAHAGKKLHEQ